MEFLSSASGWDLLIKMLFGFLAAAAGIALWAHTREPAWIVMVAATLLSYVEVLLQFLDTLGVFSLDSLSWWGHPWIRWALAASVPLLYAVGFIAAMIAIRRP